jgi:hypothetical protein
MSDGSLSSGRKRIKIQRRAAGQFVQTVRGWDAPIDSVTNARNRPSDDTSYVRHCTTGFDGNAGTGVPAWSARRSRSERS